MNSNILIVAGMHRSGTSLMAQYLDQCGLDVGNNLLNPDTHQPSDSCLGHHEDLDFLNFHMGVLKRRRKDPSGYLIRNGRSFRQGSLKLPIQFTNQEITEAKALIATRTGTSQWSWKDPRTTLFLDCWDKIVDNGKYLFLLRNPLAVADSLIRKSKNKIVFTNPINSILIWTLYNEAILSFVTQHPDRTLVCDIDNFVESSEKFWWALSEKLDLKLTNVPLEKIFSKSAFHTECSAQVKSLKDNYPTEITHANSLYQKLKGLSQP